MTRNEAINRLNNTTWFGTDEDIEETKSAIETAVEALQFAEHFNLLNEYLSQHEMVRCKDCKHWTEEKDEEDDILYGWCRAPFENDNLLVYGDDATRIFTAYDFFCKSGERRKNERSEAKET